MSKETIIAIDFDNTISRKPFPEVGDAVPQAFRWLKEFQNAGAKLFLWTIRSHTPKDFLTAAVEFCKDNGIEFWGINENPEQDWSDSNKQHANIFIDDLAIGTPLIHEIGYEPYVDWAVVGPRVLGIINERKKGYSR